MEEAENFNGMGRGVFTGKEEAWTPLSRSSSLLSNVCAQYSLINPLFFL